MSEPSQKKIEELEKENKILKSASLQWEQIQRLYKESNEKLQLIERSLTELNERMELALTAGNLAWWDWEYKTGKIYFNENRARLLGYELDELPHSFSEIARMVHPEDSDLMMKRIRQHIAGDRPTYEAEFRIRTKSGEWKWFYDKGKIVETDILGSPIRISGMLIDIHERKKAELELIVARDQADAASRAKSLFLANMSHEIRTPMSGVLGMAEILQQTSLSSEQREYLDVIVTSANNLMTILNDILDFSKIEAGKIELEKIPFSVQKVVEEVSDLLVVNAQEKRIHLLTFVDPNIPSVIKGDPVRLRQILLNISNNAIKFTERGEVVITAEFLEWDDNIVKILFRVKDTGIGISEAGIRKLFQSFSQVDASSTRKFGGTGLGLAISKRLVSHMKGEFSVESKLGIGSSFSFTAIFGRIPEEEIHDSFTDLVKGLKVLIVDDHESNRFVFRKYLERWECESEEAENASQALTMMQDKVAINRPYDLVLVDFQMPDMDGIQLARKVVHDTALKKYKMILLSSMTDLLTRKEIIDAGFRGSLSKPVKLDQLKRSIAEVLSRKEKSQDHGSEESKEPDQKPERKLRILLVEDNLINRKVALVTLNKLGQQTDVAENGKVAVDLFEKNHYDLVLMDIYMPEMDGLDATIEIRKREKSDPSRNPVYICAITANSMKEDEVRCYKAGMNNYISKPFHLDELTGVLKSL
ncbi:MAG: response regulator [bacterium]